MKKIISAGLALLFALSLCTGCSQNVDPETVEKVVSVAIDITQTALEESESKEEAESKPETAPKPTKTPVPTPTEAKAEPAASASEPLPTAESTAPEATISVVFGQDYYLTRDVAEYIHEFEELPPNYITKSEAESLGWVSSKGNLWKVAEGACIGGDRFGNREGLLPKKKGRQYYECDVNYEGGYRGTDRIIFSNDGLVYFTGDHYASFTLLYGDET